LENIRDPRSGEVLSTAESVLLAPATTAAGTAAAIRQLTPDQRAGTILGIMGGRKGRFGQDAENIVRDLQDIDFMDLSGPRGTEKIYQAMLSRSKKEPGSYFPAFVDDVEKDVRYLIPDEQAALVVKGSFGDVSQLPRLDKPSPEMKQRFGQGAWSDWIKTPYTEEELDKVTGLFSVKGKLKVLPVFEGGAPWPFFHEKAGLGEYAYGREPTEAGETKYPVYTVLEEILNDPILFEQYPRLRNVKVAMLKEEGKARGWGGSYTPSKKLISMGDFDDTDEGRQQFMSTLRHEVQHAIQHLEGHQGGVNPTVFETPEYRELASRVKRDEDNYTLKLKQLLQGAFSEGAKMDLSYLPKINKDKLISYMADYIKVAGDQTAFELRESGRTAFADAADRKLRTLKSGIWKSLHEFEGGYQRRGPPSTKPPDWDVVEEGALVGSGQGQDAYTTQAIIDQIERYKGELVPDFKKLRNIQAEENRMALGYHQKYLANPGETNARIASLTTTGLKKNKVFFAPEMSLEEAKALKKAFPNDVEIQYWNFGMEPLFARENKLVSFDRVKILNDIPGEKIREMGSPNLLRALVRGALPVDRESLKDPLVDQRIPWRSQGAPDEKRLNYLTQRLAYVRGSLEQDTLMHPVTRRKLQNEMRSIMAELRDYSPPPEQKAQGGAVGGLGVYFSKMQMQGA
jgi:hypothetical protein